MDIVTARVFAPGSQGQAWPDQILILEKYGLLAVAAAPDAGEDGRGGIKIALDAMRSHVERNHDIIDRFRRHPAPELRTRLLGVLEEAFARAAKEIFAFARRRTGLRVTMDAVLLLEHEAFVGHVGDGRVYLVRRGLVHQLTVDHNRSDEAIVFELHDEESRAQVPASASGRSVRAFGPEPTVRVETLCMELVSDDRFVVCAAPVYRAVPEGVLYTQLVTESLDGFATTLARLAAGAPIAAAAAQLGGSAPSQVDSGRSRLAILAPMPLFSHCSERELRAVAAATRPRRFAPGTTIFSQGDPGIELYLVISGTVRIERGGTVIANLGPGSQFGEMAMLDEPSRSACAVADTDCELMVIPRDAFFALLKGNPGLAVKILWNMLLQLSAHLRTTSAELAALRSAVPPRSR